ncbi:MAG: arylsulfotransferase family protein [Solirubrobacteraceae bacterium]
MTLKSLLGRSSAALGAAALSALGGFATSAHAAAPIGAYTTKGAFSYVSAPRLHPPMLHTDVRTQTSRLAPGYFMLDAFPNLTVTGNLTGEGGPLILDAKLQPVWVYPIGTEVTSTNLRQQTYNGKPVLTWWKGVVTNAGASTSGEVDIVDQHYRNVAAVKAAAPWIISVHDAVISGGDLWVTVYRTVPGQDLSAYGGSATGVVYDSGVQEYDIRTGKLLYTWDALNPGATPNIPLADSEQPAPPAAAPAGTPWDAYHINSIQLLPGNQMLVSMRNTWAAYLINTKTNQTVWTLGGKASSFNVAASAAFAWQHNAQMLPHHQVSLFNDNCCAITGPGVFARPNGTSGGLILSLNTATHTASLVSSYAHTNRPLDPAFLGSMNVLPNGNALVGWGSQPYFSEYSKSGQLLLDAIWPGKDLSYRAEFSSNWVGTPFFPPNGAARRSNGKVTVYASWDGATQVTAWKVLAGSDPNHLPVVATRARTGFETSIKLARSAKVYKVQAFDVKGHLLRTSKAFSLPKPKSLPLPPPGSY